MQQGTQTASLNAKQTKRLTHLAPLQVLVVGITINSIFVGVSLMILGYIEGSIKVAISGPLIFLAAFAFRAFIQHWISQGKIRRSATAVAAAYLVALSTATLLIHD